MKTARIQMPIMGVGSGYVARNHGSCGVRAPRNKKDYKIDIPRSNIQFINEKKKQEGRQNENHPEDPESESQDPEYGQEDFEKNKELSVGWQTLPHRRSS